MATPATPLEISVRVRKAGEPEHTIDAPVDMKGDDFIREVVTNLNWEQGDWQVTNKTTGTEFRSTLTLEGNGVQNDHLLIFNRAIVGGVLMRGSKRVS